MAAAGAGWSPSLLLRESPEGILSRQTILNLGEEPSSTATNPLVLRLPVQIPRVIFPRRPWLQKKGPTGQPLQHTTSGHASQRSPTRHQRSCSRLLGPSRDLWIPLYTLSLGVADVTCLQIRAPSTRARCWSGCAACLRVTDAARDHGKTGRAVFATPNDA
ncbi:hypothetical protein LZ30DRAFT_72554 [Colletotrichum cereale]|nr:hypothetical protein LZ30DRAFT_72554 [Colletotrichum cereale]